MSDKPITLIDRTFNLNGKKYHYKKEGEHPYGKFDEELTRGQIKEGEFARTNTALTEIKPNGEEKTLIYDIHSAYIEHNRGVQKAHGRYKRSAGNSVIVVKEADGSMRRHITTPQGERVIFGTQTSLGNGYWLDLGSKKSFQEFVQDANEHISGDFIERMKGWADSETVQKHIDYGKGRLRALNELGENSYKQLIRIMKKFRI